MAFVGCKNFVAAPITAYTAGSAITYGTGFKVGHLTRVQLDWNTSDAKLFGDNVLVESDKSATSGTITVGTTTLSDNALQKILGYEESGTDTAVVLNKTDGEVPYIGCGYVLKDSGDGTPNYIGVWNHRCQFTGNENVETRQDSTNYQAPEITGDVLGAQIDSSGKNYFQVRKSFSTEAAAIAWVNTQAGISAGAASSGSTQTGQTGQTGQTSGGGG